MASYLIRILTDARVEVELLVEVPHLVETALLGAALRLVEAHLVAYLSDNLDDKLHFVLVRIKCLNCTGFWCALGSGNVR